MTIGITRILKHLSMAVALLLGADLCHLAYGEEPRLEISEKQRLCDEDLIFGQLPLSDGAKNTLRKYIRTGFDLELDANLIAARNLEHKEFEMIASIFQGHVTFSIDTKSPRAPYRLEGISGKEFFDLAIEFFGSRAKTVEGFWISGDNLKTFNEALKNNPSLSPEMAARQTWTGQQAARHGFTRVEMLTVGSKGAFISAKVLFHKPN